MVDQPLDSAFAHARKVADSRALQVVVVILLALTVDVIVAASSDAVWILQHAADLSEGGLVTLGYRFVGYPLYVRVAHEVGTVVGLDPLFAVVVVQRLIAVGAGVYMAMRYRWAGVAMFAIVFSTTTLVQMDYILAESIAVPLCAVAALVAARAWFDTRHQIAWLSALSAIAVALSLVRLQYVSLLAVPAAIVFVQWVRTWRDRAHRGTATRATVVVLAAIVASLAFNAAVLLETSREETAVERGWAYASVEYVSAWRTVFVVEGLEPTGELGQYYADGSEYTRFVEIRTNLPKEEWERAFLEETDAIIEASGLSPTALKAKAFLWGLVGGRYDDMAGIKQRLYSPDLNVRLSATYGGGSIQRMGETEFLARFNDGRQPRAVVTSSVLSFWPQLPWRLVGIVWLLAMGAGVAMAKRLTSRLYFVVVSVPHLATAAVGATFYGDTYRWLLPTMTFSAVAVIAGMLELRRPSDVAEGAAVPQPEHA